MVSLGRKHCRTQAGLRGCHNNIQKDLHHEIEERQESLRRRGTRIDKGAIRKIIGG